MKTMKLIVVRHGETDLNKEDRLQGSKGPNVSLNESGRKQIIALRDSLLIEPEIIFASTLERTRETTAILNERFHVPVEFTPLLIERDFGSLSGKKRSEIDQQIVLDDLEGHYDYHPYGGESVADVTERIQQFITALKSRSEEVIMLVTHRGVIRILYDLYPNSVAPESVTPGSKHIFDIDN